ncbi:MAG: D-2-hydroxyacid dehydrogenase [Verrucomicrobiales bacterium]
MDQARITFLDISTMGVGDLDFSPLEALGQFQSFPTTSPDQLRERLEDVDVAIVNKVVIGGAEMEASPALKLIQLSATGYNNIDLEQARQRGVTVCNVSGYSSDSVAQHTIALMLNLVTSANRYATEIPRWCSSPIFTRLDYPITELAGKVLGLAGSGGIGSRVADIAEALGMRVQFLQRPGSESEGTTDRPRLPADEFFASSDVISLHCPLTDENRHMINATTLGEMKRHGILINTGRGDLVNELDLAAALREGTIAAAGLDVLSSEPPPPDNPLVVLAQELPERLIITPHTAWASVEARRRLLSGMVENIQAWQRGKPLNEVS